jgi:hypothetical protein
MHSPALALTGQVWLRHRLGLSICAGVWLAVAVTAQLTPQMAWGPGPEDGALRPVHFLFLFGSFMPVIAFVICAFVFNRDGPLEATDSAFPHWTFVLPVRTPTLVAWPMLQAAAMTAGVWLAWDIAVLRPAGLDLPLVWPAVLLAAVVAWMQALSWTPHPLPLLRIVTLMLAIATVALIAAYGMLEEIPDVVWVTLLAALIPLAYGVALVGVAKARRGETPEWMWPARVWKAVREWLPRRRTDFASALEAQAWFEWRVRGIGIPFAVGFILVAWVPGFLLAPRAIENVQSPESPTVTAVAHALTPHGLSLAGLLGVLPLYMGLMGFDLGGVLYKGQWIHNTRAGCHPFVGLRPLSDGEIVLAKMRTAARGTLASLALALAVVGLMLSLTGAWRELAAAPVLEPFSTWEVCVGVAAGAAILFALTWLRLVAHLWAGLSGEPWLIRTVSIIVMVAWLPLAYAVWWLFQRPTGLATLQIVAVAAVAAKFVLAAGLARHLIRRRILGAPSVALSLAAWTILAVGAITLLSRLLPGEQVPPLAVAAGVLLFMPLNRLIAAPLVLAWNRHR